MVRGSGDYGNTESMEDDVSDIYEARVLAMAAAIHETCRGLWSAAEVVDPGRPTTMHGADAHYGQAHDIVRRIWTDDGHGDEAVKAIYEAMQSTIPQEKGNARAPRSPSPRDTTDAAPARSPHVGRLG